jgi:choline dehydrogenase-like flavoprotein
VSGVITDVQDEMRTQIAIIGSGPGGAVVAENLRRNGLEVLVIEEGPYLEQDSCVPFSYLEMTQKYRCGGLTAALGRANVAYAEGRCVGGGSEVNSGLYHRAPDAVLESWSSKYQVQNFSPREMAPYFDDIERVMEPRTYPQGLPSGSALLRAGADALGWQSADIPRLVTFGEDADAQGLPRSRRNSMTDTYLAEFLSAGGQLLPETSVRKISRKGKTWKLRAIWQGRKAVTVLANQVFVCAGATQTPALLRRSGIKANVGRTLSLQPMVKITAAFREQVNWPDMGIAAEQVKEFYPQYSFGCSVSSPAHLAINLLAQNNGTQTVLEKGERLISYYVMVTGSSSGRVTVLPGIDEPLVTYRISDEELGNLGLGVKALSRLMLAAGASTVFTGVNEVPIARTTAELGEIPDRLSASSANIMSVHLMGSCPMGENRQLTAVNSWGEVHGHEGLYVADASALCEAPGVNPQGSIMAIAKRNSDHFLAAGRTG